MHGSIMGMIILKKTLCGKKYGGLQASSLAAAFAVAFAGPGVDKRKPLCYSARQARYAGAPDGARWCAGSQGEVELAGTLRPRPILESGL